jgi:4-hydroxybenzoate polyprenyltransferase
LKRNLMRLDKVIWTLVFGGLLLLGPGVALQRAGEAWGWLVIVVGALAAAVGIVLVWVRSRMPDTPGS